MAHSFTHLLSHIIFSTKDRYPFINEPLRERLPPYLGGIVRELHADALAIGGMPDHVHLLVRAPATLAIADLMRVLKTNASRWVHETWPQQRKFAWQTGYGAFSVSQSAADEVRAYIQRQAEHHQKMTFQEEFVAFLRRHGIEYDERYIWE